MLFAFSACNDSSSGGERTPAPSYPMSQLPSDLLEPEGYLKVKDSYADGYRKFEFVFEDMTAAGKERQDLATRLAKKDTKRR